MTYEPIKTRGLKEEAREYGIPEEEAVKAWEEMKREYNLPFYVYPALERHSNKVVLVPSVSINLLSKLEKEVPNWRSIKTVLQES